MANNINMDGKYNYVYGFSGRCFEMKQISEDTVMLRCSFLSKARDKNDKNKGYIEGMNASVMCRVKGDDKHPVCDIKEQDYAGKPVTVWGAMTVKENTSEKNGKTYTNFVIYADKVEETVFNNGGNNGGNGGGWGNNG